MKRERDTTDNEDDDHEHHRPPPRNRSYHDHNQTPSSNPNPNPNPTNSQIPSLPNNTLTHVVKATNSNPNPNPNPNADATASTGMSSNKEQDRFLPIANVGRIMKKAIPDNGKISKDAKETVQECVSEFISFVTGEASDKCQREKRKTINGDDILWAIMTLGFEDYVSPLKLYLMKYRDIEVGEKLNVPKQQQLQRGEQHMQHEQNVSMPYSSVYPNPNMMPQPSFVSTDPSFTLPFSSNPLQTTLAQPSATATLPQQDHVDDDHW